MRIFFGAIGVSFIMSGAVLADTNSDCAQDANAELAIRACSAIIQDTRVATQSRISAGGAPMTNRATVAKQAMISTRLSGSARNTPMLMQGAVSFISIEDCSGARSQISVRRSSSTQNIRRPFSAGG